MYTQIDNEILRSPDLTPSEMRALAVIKSYMRVPGGFCFPAYQTIADGVGVSRRQAIRLVSSLAEKGYIEVVKYYRKKLGGFGSNHYFLKDVTSRSDMDVTTHKRKENVNIIYLQNARARAYNGGFPVDNLPKKRTFARKNLAFTPVDNFLQKSTQKRRKATLQNGFVPVDNFVDNFH